MSTGLWGDLLRRGLGECPPTLPVAHELAHVTCPLIECAGRDGAKAEMPDRLGSTGDRPTLVGWGELAEVGWGLQGVACSGPAGLGEEAVTAARGLCVCVCVEGGSGILRQPKAKRPGSHLQKLGTSCPWGRAARPKTHTVPGSSTKCFVWMPPRCSESPALGTWWGSPQPVPPGPPLLNMLLALGSPCHCRRAPPVVTSPQGLPRARLPLTELLERSLLDGVCAELGEGCVVGRG